MRCGLYESCGVSRVCGQKDEAPVVDSGQVCVAEGIMTSEFREKKRRELYAQEHILGGGCLRFDPRLLLEPEHCSDFRDEHPEVYAELVRAAGQYMRAQ